MKLVAATIEEGTTTAAELLCGQDIGLNTAVIRRLKEIVPANRWRAFRASESFEIAVLLSHLSIPWAIKWVDGRPATFAVTAAPLTSPISPRPSTNA